VEFRLLLLILQKFGLICVTWPFFSFVWLAVSVRIVIVGIVMVG
jgi:hypothetical protein